MPDVRRSFPDASDFSIGIIADGDAIQLRQLLRIVADGHGDRKAIVTGIRDAFFSERALTQQLKSAANPLIALNENNYRLLDSTTHELTPAGREIKDAASEQDALILFARHILRELNGPDLLRAIRCVVDRGDPPTKETLASELNLMGYALTLTHTDQTRMAGWLRAADVLQGWKINRLRIVDIAGLSFDDLEDWSDLDEPQRAFLRALRILAEVHGEGEIAVATIRDDVEATHGQSIWKRADRVPQDVIYPLAESGWLVSPQHDGRGARQGSTRATARLLNVEMDALDRQLLSGLPREVRNGLRRTVRDLVSDLDNDNPDIAGRALEILAARIAIELGLTGIVLRDRTERTGGIEVDLVAESVGRVFTRWVLQCKNTIGKAPPEVLSREIGIAVVMHATVVALISRGGFSTRLESLAAQVTRQTHLQVILIDGSLLDRYQERGIKAIVSEVRSQAQRTADVKRSL